MPDPFHRADDVGQPDAEFLVHHDRFPTSDQFSIDQYFHWLARQLVQLDHRTLTELQQLSNQHAGRADPHRELQGNIQDEVHGVGGAGWSRLLEYREVGRAGGCGNGRLLFCNGTSLALTHSYSPLVSSCAQSPDLMTETTCSACCPFATPSTPLNFEMPSIEATT